MLLEEETAVVEALTTDFNASNSLKTLEAADGPGDSQSDILDGRTS